MLLSGEHRYSSVIAAAANDGSLWFYWQAGQPEDETGWHLEQVAPKGSVVAGE
jgi:hypothetical protein